MASAIGKIRSYGVFIEKPDINKSLWTFKPNVEENKIYFGLRGISRISVDLINDIINKRPFTSFDDFLTRVKTNKIQATMLIKAGCFDSLHPDKSRFDLIRYYCELEAETKKRLTLQNMSALIKYNILPDSLKQEKVIYLLTKHMRKYCRTNGLFKIDGTITPHLETIGFDEIIYNNNDEFINEKSWDKFYKKRMELVKQWLAEDDTALPRLNEALIVELYEKYAPDNIPSGEMEALSFYYGDHELDAHKYWLNTLNVVNFFDLPNEPEIVWESNTNSAKKYKLYQIAGTCIGRDKTKKLVGLLTPEGFVQVKVHNAQFIKFDRQIKQDGVTEKSWFAKGSKLLITGYKADENHFYPKVYKDSLFPQAIYKIGNDEELISKRLDEE